MLIAIQEGLGILQEVNIKARAVSFLTPRGLENVALVQLGSISVAPTGEEL